MYITIIAVAAWSLRCTAEAKDKAYATVLGLLVGVAACFALSGIKLDDILDSMDERQLRGARLYEEIQTEK